MVYPYPHPGVVDGHPTLRSYSIKISPWPHSQYLPDWRRHALNYETSHIGDVFPERAQLAEVDEEAIVLSISIVKGFRGDILDRDDTVGTAEEKLGEFVKQPDGSGGCKVRNLSKGRGDVFGECRHRLS